jgi:hypothetical protein
MSDTWTMKNPSEATYRSGGCACGAVRYRVRGTPFDECICHCIDCRRASGAPLLAWSTFLTEDVEWIGEPKIRRSSARARRGFCPECGAQLAFYTDARPQEIDLTLASLDEPETVTPKRHLYIKSRIAWIAVADGLPQHHERAS